MKILITSGGTKVPIDPVRDITNMSSGTFGARIAHEALSQGYDVIFLRAKNSKTPFELTVDSISTNFEEAIRQLVDLYDRRHYFKEHYSEMVFRNYDDYANTLESCLTTLQPDITILAAAVSDYGVKNPADSKLRSKNELTIQLEPLPKLISRVKGWAPNTVLVGFKLLVNSTVEELLAAAQKSINENDCDLVVANDLRDILNSDHTLRIVGQYEDRSHSVYKASDAHQNPYYLAQQVIQAARIRYFTNRRKQEKPK